MSCVEQNRGNVSSLAGRRRLTVAFSQMSPPRAVKKGIPNERERGLSARPRSANATADGGAKRGRERVRMESRFPPIEESLPMFLVARMKDEGRKALSVVTLTISTYVYVHIVEEQQPRSGEIGCLLLCFQCMTVGWMCIMEEGKGFHSVPCSLIPRKAVVCARWEMGERSYAVGLYAFVGNENGAWHGFPVSVTKMWEGEMTRGNDERWNFRCGAMRT